MVVIKHRLILTEGEIFRRKNDGITSPKCHLWFREIGRKKRKTKKKLRVSITLYKMKTNFPDFMTKIEKFRKKTDSKILKTFSAQLIRFFF